jgi:hypothetical protein
MDSTVPSNTHLITVGFLPSLFHRKLPRATTITPQDLERDESSPRPIPTDYHGLASLLFSYLRLLEVLVGRECSHFKGVSAVRLTLVWSQHSIATILWESFIDPRQFFSTSFGPNGEPPSSLLSLAEGSLRTGTIKAEETAPYARLMGQTRFAPVLGFGCPMAANQLPPPVPAGRLAPGNLTESTNTATFPKIKNAMLHVLATYPDALATTMLGAADHPIRVTELKFPRGSCAEYNVFGRCRVHGCTYQHIAATSPMGDDKVVTVVALLDKAAIAYMTKRLAGLYA